MMDQVSSSAVVNADKSVFFQPPEKVVIDEDAKTRYSTSLKIETLIQELKERGPLVAFGYMGPGCYRCPPFQLKGKFGENRIFGWRPGTRKESAEKVYAMVIGARKVEDKEYVYFRMSCDSTLDKKTYIREHQSTIDSRVYVSSHKTFSEYLVDLYPPVAEEKKHPNFVSAGSLHCSLKELEYVVQLVSIMPLDSILGERESECKALGQNIFDMLGRNAVVNICDAVKFCAKDGSFRKQYIERAWDGIGDENWRFLC